MKWLMKNRCLAWFEDCWNYNRSPFERYRARCASRCAAHLVGRVHRYWSCDATYARADPQLPALPSCISSRCSAKWRSAESFATDWREDSQS